MYEIRRIDRAIGNATTGIVAFENNNKETDMPMIAEVDHAAIARAQEYWGDVQDSHTVQQAKTPGQQQHDKQRGKLFERLEVGALDFVLECNEPVVLNAPKFCPIACAEQFNAECG